MYEVGAAGTALVELFDEDSLEWIQRNLTVDNGGRDYPHELAYDTGKLYKILCLNHIMYEYTYIVYVHCTWHNFYTLIVKLFLFYRNF